ncbi:MAG: DUF1501 domain-containing protein [Saprospiraceae bacterium]
MKRRSFLKRASAATLPVMVGGLKVSALNNPFFNLLNTDDDKVLVLIQLSGGNDGLNMIIPRDQYAGLAEVRNNVVVPENSILGLTDTVGVHPVMSDLKNVWDDGKLNVVQNVAYPNQNRSHFRSSDIWHTGSPADETWTQGWLGRYFDLLAPGYPDGYPNAENPDPFAVTIGSSVSETCEGMGGNFSLALLDPDNLATLATPINATQPNSCFGDKMDFLVTSIVQTNAYNEVIETASANGSNISTKYPDNNNLAYSLKTVARLIAGGLKTKVYVVTLGGFDTHADQVLGGDTTSGIHAELLNTLSTAICAFQDDLKLLGLEERVLGMTYSEFGRRIRSNAGNGTDHGTAAPMMLFGSCVNPTILGDNPEINTDVDQNEGVPMQFDFRSVYGSVLMDWFGLEEQVVKDLLYEDFQYLQVVDVCSTDTSVKQVVHTDLVNLEVYPNPFNNTLTIEFTVPSSWVKISIFDVIGNELKILTNQHFSEGKHTLAMEGEGLPAGTYNCHVQTDFGRKVKRIVKVK